MGKITIRHKLLKIFIELGVEMKRDSCGLYIVKYDSIDYFLDLNGKEDSFCILKTVMGLQGDLSQVEFDMMLDVVRGFYKEYNGEWNEGVSYVYSPLYNVNKPHEFNSKNLEKIIKDFFQVWSFACANACLITALSIGK